MDWFLGYLISPFKYICHTVSFGVRFQSVLPEYKYSYFIIIIIIILLQMGFSPVAVVQ
jgi:hypothetical protein